MSNVMTKVENSIAVIGLRFYPGSGMDIVWDSDSSMGIAPWGPVGIRR